VSTGRVDSRRQLLIGLDAMEWNLVSRWAGDGRLPTFRRLLDGGTRAELSTTSAQLPDTVWAPLYTGLNPGQLEKYFYVQYDPTTMALRHVLDDAIRRTPFWELLSQAGHRVVVADAPKFPLSRALNGVRAPVRDLHATKTARASTPPALLAEFECPPGSPSGGRLRSRGRSAGRAPRATEPRTGRRARSRPAVSLANARAALRRVRGRFLGSALHWPPPLALHGFDASAVSARRSARPGRHHRAGLSGHRPRDRRADHRRRGHSMGPIYHASWNLPEMRRLLDHGRKPTNGDHGRSAHRDARANHWRMLRLVLPGWLQGHDVVARRLAADGLLAPSSTPPRT
jgi:hypothetical protein